MPPLRRRRISLGWWVGLLTAAQLTDLLTTAASLHLGGREANPLVLGIVAGGGLGAYLVAKLLATAAVLLLLVAADGLRRWLPEPLSEQVLRALTLGFQVAVAIPLLAALTNLVVLGRQAGLLL
jgi:hypothetical protein